MTKKINLKSPLLLSILTGFLIGTSTIPFPPWALFFCLSPLFYIWVTESPKKVFLYTTLSFTIASLIGFFWVGFLIKKFALLPLTISALLCFLFAIFCHIHLSVMGWIFAKWIKRFATFPTLAATSIFAFSWLVFPILFPWNFGLGWLYGGLKGYQFADTIGIEGLSTLTIFMNGFFLFSLINIKKNKIYLSSGVLFLLIFNFAGSLYEKTLKKTNDVYKVVVAQANIGNLETEFRRNPGNYKHDTLSKYFKLSEDAIASSGGSADLIIWPETAFPEYYDKHFFKSSIGRRLTRFIEKNQTPVITGIFAETKNEKTANAALVLDQNAKPIGLPVYKKILLAFGEYMPLETYFPTLRKWFPMVGNFEAGTSPQVKSINGTNVGVQICYEGVFPGFSRKLSQKGAQVMINLTNDSWYGLYSEPWQHMYLSAFRAIETRTPLIRSTNTGISTAVLADGSFLEQSPLEKEWSGVFRVPVEKNKKLTIYTRWGFAIPLPLTLIVFILSLIYGKQRP
jgi:apolipoprotein N-acyltransferase